MTFFVARFVLLLFRLLLTALFLYGGVTKKKESKSLKKVAI